ncbi:hypothetical protein [Bradyrhizobium sp. USDA 4504]
MLGDGRNYRVLGRFAETGEEGASLQQQMLDAARSSGVRILGPNSLGVLNPRIGFYGSFMSVVKMGFPRARRVGIASQSGAYGSHILGLAREFGIGVSLCVMTGNECDISLAELVHALVEDADTDVITMYSEGIRDGDRLLALEAARQARKPVVMMMKVCSSAIGSAVAHGFNCRQRRGDGRIRRSARTLHRAHARLGAPGHATYLSHQQLAGRDHHERRRGCHRFRRS